MRRRDYYGILGVDRGATRDEIQDAFHALARKYHPDVNPDPRVVERFKDISAAYEVLSDPRQKAQYDRQTGASEQHTSQAHGYSGDTAWHQQTTYNRQAGAWWYSEEQRTSSHIPRDELPSITVLAKLIRLGAFLIVAILGISAIIDAMLVFVGTALGSWVTCLIAIPLLGSIVSLGIGLYLRERSKCPRCGKLWARQVLSKEKRDPLYKEVLLKGPPSVAYVRFRVHHRCKYCAYRWTSSQATLQVS
jgi:hypothetical protein